MLGPWYVLMSLCGFASQSYEVTYVRNITDIDDKIITRASERGLTIDKITALYIKAMHNSDTPGIKDLYLPT